MSTDTDTDTTVDESAIRERIDRAAAAVGPVWPIHSFVTANPLQGFEERPFPEAVARASRLLGGRGYPSAETFRRAFEAGRIDPDRLDARLAEHGYDSSPAELLARMAETESESTSGSGTDVAGEGAGATDAATDRVDRLLTKWLTAFLDEGQAEWPMPNREAGFYAAVRTVARYDRRLPDRDAVADLPERPVEAIERVIAPFPVERWEAIIEHHLTALPGWTGFVKHRAEAGGAWQAAHPITLADYLAVRLTLVDLLDAPVAPPNDETAAPVAGDAANGTGDAANGTGDAANGTGEDGRLPLPAVWLDAWEATYRAELVDAVADASETRGVEAEPDGGADDDSRPAAQFVFCIDTRSEVIRRHVERAGPYETHGYAGFFGVPMRYTGYGDALSVDACPPIVDAQHRVDDRPTPAAADERERYDRWASFSAAAHDVVETLKTNAATAFNFVESAGGVYGAALAARTLLPERIYDLREARDARVPADHEFCAPTLDRATADHDHDRDGEDGDLPRGLTLSEKVDYAAAAFDLMGWEEFARVVVFAGHASQTANNPFEASLDCGACAGNPGGPSARVLAAICNDEAVRAALRDRGIDVPDDTVFVAGEHDTTTDEVTLYDGQVPESHRADVDRIRADLAEARAGAAAERVETMGGDPTAGVREVERRAADWAETRPEWGLAGNAGFVIGPRALTADLDLDGRSFLHSYDWRTDPDGDALEAIMAGPMVVTQWINSQYYFASVDTAVYGSGSKITHNPVGNVGVFQGNGGDLMSGLPLQSLRATDDDPYHQPLRLSTVVHAPVDRVTAVLERHDHLRDLLDNGWLSLTVVDPTADHAAFHYAGDCAWDPAEGPTPAAESTEPATPEPEVEPEPEPVRGTTDD